MLFIRILKHTLLNQNMNMYFKFITNNFYKLLQQITLQYCIYSNLTITIKQIINKSLEPNQVTNN